MIIPNIETGEPELNIIDEKYQYKKYFILNDYLSDTQGNQINDEIKEKDFKIMVQLDHITWRDFNPLHLFEYNNITTTIQNGGTGIE